MPNPVAPTLNVTGYVNSVVIIHNTLILGGGFTAVQGISKQNLAAIDLKDGSVLAAFPEADQEVLCLASDGQAIYAGGSFERIGPVTRLRIAKISAQGAVLPWKADANGSVRALSVSDGRVYVGGEFRSLQGEASIGSRARNFLAALDGWDAAVLPWQPKLFSSSAMQGPGIAKVNALLATPGGVYVGGAFEGIGGELRKNLAAVNAADGGTLSFRADTDAEVDCLALAGRILFVGGKFSVVEGQARSYAAALHDDSGSLEPWAPDLDYFVHAIVPGPHAVFLGGRFSKVQGRVLPGAAMVGFPQPEASAVDNDIEGAVYSMAVEGKRLALGGVFKLRSNKNLASVLVERKP